MAWARIDDAFDDNAKVLALLEHDDGVTAVGLWTLCLAWAHRNTRRGGKAPGVIPASLPRRYLGPQGKAMAALLVEVGLWDVLDGGWKFHDFEQYLPSDETKAARSAAGKLGAQKRWGNKQPSPTSEEPADPEQPDSKLPSGSHDDATGDLANDGTAEANDGSRAGAHRVIPYGITPTPTPEPVPPTAGAGAPRPAASAVTTTAQTITGEWIERCQSRPPQKVIGQLGKEIKALLGEGIPPDDVRRGVATWMAKGLHPSTLPSVVNEAMNAGAASSPPQSRNAQIVDASLQRAMALEERMREAGTLPTTKGAIAR
ncbi:hypothetical protein OG884_15650 [Streptosporangium sp. NBC_01755]|uniref:hypothetical protein n=1 Tax=Streptosporangium sp. NBC_01755 TaxID=2975949 RepID=UPI002DDBF964|nr:hypothetical protein [Streptosporangium sp. NBC_01755]WSD03268.1 hypothetical protein OG884_15650 [Streptosporangium sp. NBC_01755]